MDECVCVCVCRVSYKIFAGGGTLYLVYTGAQNHATTVQHGLQKQCKHNQTVPNCAEPNRAGTTSPYRASMVRFGYDVIITHAQRGVETRCCNLLLSRAKYVIKGP